MRKIKIDLQCRVPSWNYCNYDGFTTNGRYSKELCKFCSKTKTGHHCLLHDEPLTAGPTFVNKAQGCIEATAGYAVTADEPVTPAVEPRVVIRETITEYRRMVTDLIRQGYPQNMAETLAARFMTEGR